MGFMDALLGRRKTKASAPDRLFAITTAYVTLEAQNSITSSGAAAIVFQPLPTGDFQQIVSDVEQTVRGTGQETGTSVETHDDEFSYRWMVLRDDELEDLAVGINAVSDALAINGYKDRVLCAVFATPPPSRCTSSTTTSAGPGTPSSRPPATSSARPSASSR
jgi:hypothetical protein